MTHQPPPSNSLGLLISGDLQFLLVNFLVWAGHARWSSQRLHLSPYVRSQLGVLKAFDRHSIVQGTLACWCIPVVVGVSRAADGHSVATDSGGNSGPPGHQELRYKTLESSEGCAHTVSWHAACSAGKPPAPIDAGQGGYKGGRCAHLSQSGTHKSRQHVVRPNSSSELVGGG
jgi:hypothetical protein